MEYQVYGLRSLGRRREGPQSQIWNLKYQDSIVCSGWSLFIRELIPKRRLSRGLRLTFSLCSAFLLRAHMSEECQNLIVPCDRASPRPFLTRMNTSGNIRLSIAGDRAIFARMATKGSSRRQWQTLLLFRENVIDSTIEIGRK